MTVVTLDKTRPSASPATTNALTVADVPCIKPTRRLGYLAAQRLQYISYLTDRLPGSERLFGNPGPIIQEISTRMT